MDVLEATEGLVVLREDADHLFGGIVGGWDVLVFDAIDQVGPVAFQEVEDDGGIWRLGGEGGSLCQHLLVALLGRAFGAGVEDVLDLFPERLDFRIAFGVAVSVGLFEHLVDGLQRVEDAFVVHGARKDLGDDVAIVHAHVGDDDARVVALGT